MLAWARAAAVAADAKQGREPIVLAVGAVLGITDYFVITSASNHRLVRTIAEEVERAVVAAGAPPPRTVEGVDDFRWVLLDFGVLVVHVFDEEARVFYDLERLWGDVERVPWVDGAT